MTTGSDVLWELSVSLGVVPIPPNEALARLLSNWWEGPRTFGCVSAKSDPAWVVVAPDPAIWCPTCAVEKFGRENRCCYCHRRMRRTRGQVLVYEMAGGVRVVARAHDHCHEEKTK